MPLTRVGKWSVIYGIVAVEVAVLMGSYRVWHKMNISQEYRKQMYQNYPSVLEAFYKSCTLVGINGVKESDIKHWTREEGSD